MSCFSCGRGFHWECVEPREEDLPCCCPPDSKTGFAEDKPTLGRPRKPDHELSASAGRKRAAELYPLDHDMPCEWALQANCGGGKFPIMGCVTGKQRHIHHGPVKATFRNERENISLICTTCHNQWHAKNDPVYDEEEYNLLPKNPRPQTAKETLERAQR